LKKAPFLDRVQEAYDENLNIRLLHLGYKFIQGIIALAINAVRYQDYGFFGLGPVCRFLDSR